VTRVEQKQVWNKNNTVVLLLLETCFCSTRVTCRVTLVTNLFLLYPCHLSCYSCYKPVSVLHVSPFLLLLLQTCFCSTRVTCCVTLVTNLCLFYTCHLSCYSCYNPVSVLHLSPVVLLLLQTCFCSTRVTCRATLVTHLSLFYTLTRVTRQVTRVEQKQVCNKSSTTGDRCRTETGL
jgi:hypothetical protein